jgi:hypothetical protein
VFGPLHDEHTPREYHPWEKAQFLDAADDLRRGGKLGENAAPFLRVTIGLLEKEGKFLSKHFFYPDYVVLSRGEGQQRNQPTSQKGIGVIYDLQQRVGVMKAQDVKIDPALERTLTCRERLVDDSQKG